MNHFISGDAMRLLSYLTVFMLPYLVFANDGFGALGAGGIIIGKTDDIAMAKEVLDISCDKIKVDYEFVNESDKDITETIVFPLPPYTDGSMSDADKRTIRNFKVIVNGKSAKFKKKVRAITWQNIDITQKLKRIGFTDDDIVEVLFNENELLKKKEKLLIQNGIIDPKIDAPLWTNYVVYEWKQTFKAHQKISVSHTYTPLGSGGSVGNYEHESFSRIEMNKKYCVDSKTADKLDNLAKDDRNWGSYPGLPGTEISYILRTANTWKDGIRDFHLILRTKTPNETVSTCFSKSIQQTSPTTYEVKLKNFKPKEDLSVYFGNRDTVLFNPEVEAPIVH